VDLDGNGTLDVDEFLNLLDRHYSFCEADPNADLEPVYRLLARKDGCVRAGDLRDMLLRYNCRPDWTREESDELLKGISEDPEEMVDFASFVSAVVGR